MGFRQATFYLAELFLQARFYLAELVRQATFYLGELFRQITSLKMNTLMYSNFVDQQFLSIKDAVS